MKDLKSYLSGAIATATLFAVLGSQAIAETTMEIEAGIGGADPDPDAPLVALGEPPIPLDNPQTDAKIELGKMLFFDPRLGGNP